MIRAATVALAAAACFGCGYYLRSMQADADRAAQLQVDARQQWMRQERADQAAGRHERFRAAEQARQAVITREVERVVERPGYRDVCLDADGLRLVAAALAGSAPDPGQPAPALQDSRPSR